jgi:hypothetical protein
MALAHCRCIRKELTRGYNGLSRASKFMHGRLPCTENLLTNGALILGQVRRLRGFIVRFASWADSSTQPEQKGLGAQTPQLPSTLNVL